MKEQDKYAELVHKLRTSHKTFQKMQRKIMNEPDSDIKWAKLELMELVLNRSKEIVNWWDNYDRHVIGRQIHQQNIERHNQKLINKAKVEKAIEEALNPPVYEQEWNYGCRYYNQDSRGNRSCSCGMDMVFCSKKCAFATNVSGSTKAYDAPVYENRRRKG